MGGDRQAEPVVLLAAGGGYEIEFTNTPLGVRDTKTIASTDAIVNLGVLLEDTDPQAARDWYEKAANAVHSDAMFNLGVLLERTDPESARGWV